MHLSSIITGVLSWMTAKIGFKVNFNITGDLFPLQGKPAVPIGVCVYVLMYTYGRDVVPWM